MFSRLLLISLLLCSTAFGQGRWENVDGHPEARQYRLNDNGTRTRAMVGRSNGRQSADLEVINWYDMLDSTYFRILIDVNPNMVSFSGDTTIIEGGNFNARLYGDDNGLEWEAILESRPGGQFSFEFPIEHNNLEFYFQPPLTQEQLDDPDCVYGRPDSVVNSWAVYHSFKGGGVMPGTDLPYRNGKAFHIYRPKAWDTNGDTVWLDLAIDPIGNTITLSGERAWFRDAVYPVTIDPYFGWNGTPGASTAASSSRGYGFKIASMIYTAGASDNVDSVYCYLNDSNAGIMAIYDIQTGEPTNRIGGLTGDITANQSWTATAHSVALTNGVTYTAALGAGSGVTTTIVYDDFSPDSVFVARCNTNLPDPFVNNANREWRAAMYAAFNVEAAGADAYGGQVIMMRGD